MSELGTVTTYCPECDREVDANVIHRREELPVKGEPTAFEADVAVCPACGCEIGDSRIEDGNLRRAYSAYCSAHGLMSPDEIHDLRNRYGLSLRDFSKFLGFGEQTIARYEGGAIPDESHNTTLMLASTAHGAASLLSVRKDRLSERSIRAVQCFVEKEASLTGSDGIGSGHCQWPTRRMMEPSSINGFRPLSMRRVAAVVCELASRCTDLYYTKLQKAMFFTDFHCYAKTVRSMTGLIYAHATHGPVMDGKDRIRAELQDCGIIKMSQKGWGEIVLPGNAPQNVLSSDELQIIATVARFVNTFSSATDISSFSHGLSAWTDTSDGEPIDYASNAEQVEGVIERRLAEYRSM